MEEIACVTSDVQIHELYTHDTMIYNIILWAGYSNAATYFIIRLLKGSYMLLYIFNFI